MNTEYLKAMLVQVRSLGPEPESLSPAFFTDLVAGGLLRDLIAAELSARNLLTEPAPTGLCHFAGFLLFDVADVGAAAAVTWPVFQRNHLDQIATIFAFDGQEEIWWSIYPRLGIGLLHDDLRAWGAAMVSKSEETLALWKRAIALSKQNGQADQKGPAG